MKQVDLQEEAGGGRSTKEDWLNLAKETLIGEGIDQVKIQVMAKKLRVSRSSFYWFSKAFRTCRISCWITG